MGGAKGSDLAAQIAGIQNPELRRALSSLFDQANHEAAKFEKALETWFNESMDRVSGWYKRWIQYWLFGLGLALAAAANVDTIHIIGALSTDPKMQLDAAKASIEYLKAQSATQTADGSTSNSSPTGTPVQGQNPESSPQETTKPEGSGAPSSTATPNPLTTAQSLETAATDLASLERAFGLGGSRTQLLHAALVERYRRMAPDCAGRFDGSPVLVRHAQSIRQHPLGRAISR